jgi:ligand-binding SRPBCC domain-containing protein
MKQQMMARSNIGHDTLRIARALRGRGYRLEASQWLPRSPEEIFGFFSDAFELQTLTPSWLRFCVLTPPPIHMRAGVLIDYRLQVHGLPLRWQSRIDQWSPPIRFTDVQTRGPYRYWSHEHIFQPLDGGTLCRDIVEYQVYGGMLVHALFVRRDLSRIFKYRQTILQQLFPGKSGDSACDHVSP